MNKKAEGIFGLILIVFLILSLLTYIAKDIIKDNKAMNNFCKENGFNKKTDSSYHDFFPNYVHIECDEKKIFKNLIFTERCVEYDKFDNCIKKQRFVME